jgi:hypothetical protein
VNQRGNIILDGVELDNMGQRDNEKAAIRIHMTNSDGDHTIVKNSAIHDCEGQCVNSEYGGHVKF